MNFDTAGPEVPQWSTTDIATKMSIVQSMSYVCIWVEDIGINQNL